MEIKNDGRFVTLVFDSTPKNMSAITRLESLMNYYPEIREFGGICVVHFLAWRFAEKCPSLPEKIRIDGDGFAFFTNGGLFNVRVWI